VACLVPKQFVATILPALSASIDFDLIKITPYEKALLDTPEGEICTFKVERTLDGIPVATPVAAASKAKGAVKAVKVDPAVGSNKKAAEKAKEEAATKERLAQIKGALSFLNNYLF
jgi:hypothetical protein